MQKRIFSFISSFLILIWLLPSCKKHSEIPQNYGTLDALFDQTKELLIVQGTHGFKTENKVLFKWANYLQEMFKRKGAAVLLVTDAEVNVKRIKDKHIILVGRPEANLLLKEYLPNLPLNFYRNMVQIGNKVTQTIFGDGAQICTVVPNPENQERMLGIFSIIYEKEIEKMWWSATPYGEYADYVMWQPTKGPTAGGGFTQRGMFSDISSNYDLLVHIEKIKSKTWRAYQHRSFSKIAEISRSVTEVKTEEAKPILQMDQLKRRVDVKVAKVFLHYSPFTDFMFLLYINPSWEGINFERLLYFPIPLGKYGLVTLPEYVIVDDVTQYSQLYSLAKMYDSSSKTERMLTHSKWAPSYDQVVRTLKTGKSKYPRFFRYWKRYLEPIEKRIIQRWEQDFKTTKPLHYLQKLTGLQWPYDEIHLCISAFHPSGSALPSDPFIFSSIFNVEKLLPNAAWVIGHEGTHLLLDAQMQDWKKTAEWKAVIERWGSNAEEALCLLMQNRLAWICGFISEEEIQKFDSESSYGPARLASVMAQHWDSYMKNTQKYPTIIDFMIKVALSNE